MPNNELTGAELPELTGNIAMADSSAVGLGMIDDRRDRSTFDYNQKPSTIAMN